MYYKPLKRIANIIIFTETYYALERNSTEKVISQEPQPPAVSNPSKNLMRDSKTGLVQIQPLSCPVQAWTGLQFIGRG